MRRSTITWIVSVTSTAPFIYLLWLTLGPGLGAQPAEALNRKFGEVTLILLVTNLYFGVLLSFVRPLPAPLRWIPAARRPLGVAAFVYLLFHVAFHFVKEGDLALGLAEIAKRVYLLAGAGAFLILLGMALTSNDRAVRALGFRRWKGLHRLVHLATVLLVFHRTLIEKADLIEAALYFVPLLALQGVRVVRHLVAPILLVCTMAATAEAAPKKTWEGAWWSEDAKLGLVLVARSSLSAEDRVTGFVTGMPEARVLGGSTKSGSALTVRLELPDGRAGRRRLGCATLALTLSKDGGALAARSAAPSPGSRCRAIPGFGEGLKLKRARQEGTAESWRIALGALEAEAALVRDPDGRLLGGRVRTTGRCAPEGCSFEVKSWKASAAGLVAELRGESETRAERCLAAPWSGRTRSFGSGCLFVRPEKGCPAQGTLPAECGESVRAWRLSYAPLATIAGASRLAGRLADSLEPGKFDSFAPLLLDEFLHDGKRRGVASLTWRNRAARPGLPPAGRVSIDGIVRVGGPGEDPRSSRSLSQAGSWMEWRATVHSSAGPLLEISVSPGGDDAFLWLEESDGTFLFSGNGSRTPPILELPGEEGSFLASDLPRRWLERPRPFGAPTAEGTSTGWALTLKPDPSAPADAPASLPVLAASPGVVDRVAWDCARGRFEVRVAHRGGALYSEYRNLSTLGRRWIVDAGRGPGECGKKPPENPDQPPCDDEALRTGCPVQRDDAIGSHAEGERVDFAVLDADRRPVCPIQALTDAEGYLGAAAAAGLGDRGEAGPESLVLPFACNESGIETPRVWRLRETKAAAFPAYVRIGARPDRGCAGAGTRCYSYSWEGWSEKDGSFGKPSTFRVLESQGEAAGWHQPLDFGDSRGPSDAPALQGLLARVTGTFSRGSPELRLKSGSLSAVYEPVAAGPLLDVPVRGPGPFARIAPLSDLDGDGADELALGNPDFDGGRGNVVIVSGKDPGRPLACVSGVSPGARFGQAIGRLGADFFVGAPGEAAGEGRVYVLRGAALAQPSAEGTAAAPSGITLLPCVPPLADAKVLAPPEGRPGEAFGTSAAGLGDLLAVGSPGYAAEGASGRVTIWNGGAVVRVHPGRAPGFRFGRSVSALDDLDGDGAADLLVGAPAAAPVAPIPDAGAAPPAEAPAEEPEAPPPRPGQVLVFSGAVKGPDAPILSLQSGGPGFGGEVSGGGDFDGDGAADLAATDTESGETGVFSGRTGARLASAAGTAAGPMADFDGDGLADLALLESGGEGNPGGLAVLGAGRELLILRGKKDRSIGAAAFLRGSLAVIEDGRLAIFAP